MLDQNFCTFLEYHLSKCFKYSNDEALKGFWCDGVTLPENKNDYSIRSINEKRQVLSTVFLARDGQEKYSLLILFGRKSLNRYAQRLNLENCVPDFEKNDWYFVDNEKKQITIQLY